MHQLFQLLRPVCPLSDELVQYLSHAFEYRHIKKGDYLLKEGQVCRHMFFIESGLVRYFLYRGEKEVVTRFQTEGNMVISHESFYDQVPSDENIVALEDCEVYRISYEDLMHVYDHYPDALVLRAKLTERYYRILWKCFINTRLNTAQERYRFFIDNFPQWVNRVPEKDIAAFLGITPSHFSRSKG
ncbi:Crp/Fnr family transcriptional regulator [Panacibacter ginsenosidivorans]|uniref:Crp/Fnr family transcriptional regulator n=1 Tax=Panacibacter ginsenosidivorans TaxID=1813871 RepID=A0A5B8VCP1_9BACT|nr:Crp/Fnr family transcriptional regulator [Panacibacter ginsenosidivorans]QEC69297.1 Crp/Fnr family transcriptional regulator [Panacibacter ginsenosidivorans]